MTFRLWRCFVLIELAKNLIEKTQKVEKVLLETLVTTPKNYQTKVDRQKKIQFHIDIKIPLREKNKQKL